MSKAYKFGVIGQNISYSKSSDINREMCRQAGIEGEFRIVSVDPAELPTALGWVKSETFTGLSVTIPYKEAIVQYVDSLKPVALALNAVNSMGMTGSDLVGSNTDWIGCSRALKNHAQQLNGGRAVVLGCGGSARAVVYSLVTDYAMDSILVLGRSQPKLGKFSNVLSSCTGGRGITTGLFSEFDRHVSGESDIIVNCTPLGGWNCPEESPVPANFDWARTKLYFDLNYNEGNKLVGAARQAGATAFGGSLMLVAQAVQSLKEWTGIEADVDTVHTEVFGDG